MKKIIILFFAIFVLLSNVNATMVVKNYSIDENYYSGDSIQGTINFSLKDEFYNSTFTDSENNNLTLGEFLKKTNYQHNCSTDECKENFVETNSRASLTFNLKNNESKIIGFVFKKNIEEIKSFNMKLTSDVGTSETNQIILDFFDNGQKVIKNNKSNQTENLIKRITCSESTPDWGTVNITNKVACQKFNFSESHEHKIGGVIKKENEGTNNIKVSLYSTEGNYLTSCNIDNSNINNSFIEKTCEINYSIEEKEEYVVCITSENRGTSSFYTRGYQPYNENNSCGSIDYGSQDFIANYNLVAYSKKFDSVGDILIQDTDNFPNYLEYYIKENYGSLQCSEESPCYVPLKITANKNQTINLSNLKIDYETEASISTSINLYSELSIEPTKATGSFQNVIINNIFYIGDGDGKKQYELSFNGKKIIDEEIDIAQLNFKITPTTAIRSYPHSFNITTDSNLNFTSCYWDFGDNTNETTKTAQTTHVYNRTGNQTINAILTTKEGKNLTREFSIEVKSPNTWINFEIKKFKAIIENIEDEISKLSTEEKELVKTFFDTKNLTEQMNQVEENFKLLNPTDDPTPIVNFLLNFEYPEKITNFQHLNIPFYFEEDSIPLEFLKQSNSEEIQVSDSELKKAIVYFGASKLFLEISEDILQIEYNTNKKSAINTFSLSINPEKSVGNYYLFFDKNTISPIGKNQDNETGDYGYFKLSGRNTINFKYISEDYAGELPISASPVLLSELEINSLGDITELKEINKPLLITIAFIILLSLGFFLYFLLSKWYNTKYERYLFTDKNNLYNVMIYVNNSKKAGMEDSEIKNKLLKSGWSREQINYIMKKFENKNTGMPKLILKKETNKLAHIKKEKHTKK